MILANHRYLWHFMYDVINKRKMDHLIPAGLKKIGCGYLSYQLEQYYKRYTQNKHLLLILLTKHIHIHYNTKVNILVIITLSFTTRFPKTIFINILSPFSFLHGNNIYNAFTYILSCRQVQFLSQTFI